MLRFSSSGDLSIADLRIALFNHIVAKQRGENMIVRIEDTDPQNMREDADKEVAGILTLFGIEYQNVVLQSSHLRYHRTFAIQMLQEKRAFNCFCTPEDLDRKRKKAEADNVTYRYDDTCSNLPPEATIDNENPFTVRLHHPHTAIVINDLVQGEMSFSPEEVDSFVLLNAQKLPTAIFANAIDDMLNNITLVIRDESHLHDTPGQIAMRHAIGYGEAIAYAHIPSLQNAQEFDVKSLLEAGYMPSAIANYLILISCSDTPKEIFTLQEAIEWFSLEKIDKAPAGFDIGTLKLINREHLRRMDVKELSRYVGFADEDIGNVALLHLDEASTLKELRTKIEPIFARKVIPEAYAQAAETIKEAMKSAPYFDSFDGFKSYLLEATGLEEEILLASLRLLLTGAEHGPELADIYRYLKNYLGEIIK